MRRAPATGLKHTWLARLQQMGPGVAHEDRISQKKLQSFSLERLLGRASR